jgi:hypothetical protein
MKFLPALVPLLFTSLLARADIVIVEKVNGPGQSGQMTVKVGGDLVRSDISPQVSTITNSATGDITTLAHAQKVFMVISAASAKAMLAQMTSVMQHANPVPSGSPAPPKPTGKTDKINGYNAAEYAFDNGIIKGSFWMSAEFPNAGAVRDALAKFRKGSLADMTKAFAPDISALPGVPVKTEVEFNGQKMETELVSATDEKVDPAEYKVPPGYTEMKMPAGTQFQAQ